MQYNQIFARLNPWYLAYCKEYGKIPYKKPPIRVMYAARRMMDLDSQNGPKKTDSQLLEKHFATPPRQPWQYATRSTNKPLNPRDPVHDYCTRRNHGEHLPISVLAKVLGINDVAAKQRYYRWCRANDEICVAQRHMKTNRRGVKKLTPEQIAEIVRLYTEDNRSTSDLAKRFKTGARLIQIALTQEGVILRDRSEAQRLRYLHRTDKPTPPKFEDLDPWIRPIVERLWKGGWITTDSGDGNKVGMEGALPYPHVFIKSKPEQLIDDCERLERILWWPVLPEIQGTYNTIDRQAIIMVSWPETKV